MSNTVSRMVPRRASAPVMPTPTEPTSGVVRDDIARLDAEREAAASLLADLAAGRNAVLLTGDDAAAECHDAEMARQRRAIERCDLRRPGLENALADALAREEAARKAAQVAEAEAAITAVMSDLSAEYMAPAAKIAAFLARYTAANAKAKAAGIDDIDRRIRFKAGSQEPDFEQEFTVYIDSRGVEVDSPYPPGTYHPHVSDDGSRYDPQGHPIPPYPKRRKVRTVRGKVIPDQWLPALATVVNLPAPQLGEPDFHHASGLERPTEEHRRGFIL